MKRCFGLKTGTSKIFAVLSMVHLKKSGSSIGFELTFSAIFFLCQKVTCTVDKTTKFYICPPLFPLKTFCYKKRTKGNVQGGARGAFLRTVLARERLSPVPRLPPHSWSSS
jgi:hypothetical protein